MQAIEDSLVAACNRDFGKNAVVKVNMDRETGDISVYVEKTVVEEVEDPATEISYSKELWKNRITACKKCYCAED